MKVARSIPNRLRSISTFSLVLLMFFASPVFVRTTRPQSTRKSADWVAFYSAFRSAVRKRDKQALKSMMAIEFNKGAGISYSDPDARDAVLRDMNWKGLDQVLRKGVSSVKSQGGKSIRHIPSQMSDVGMVAFFELRNDGRWEWSDYYFYH